MKVEKVTISAELYDKFNKLGLIPNEVRNHNVGQSDYSKKVIQPYSVWIDWNLNPWDADIVKRIARTKEGEDKVTKYNKIIHIAQECLRQIEAGVELK